MGDIRLSSTCASLSFQTPLPLRSGRPHGLPKSFVDLAFLISIGIVCGWSPGNLSVGYEGCAVWGHQQFLCRFYVFLLFQYIVCKPSKMLIHKMYNYRSYKQTKINSLESWDRCNVAITCAACLTLLKKRTISMLYLSLTYI